MTSTNVALKLLPYMEPSDQRDQLIRQVGAQAFTAVDDLSDEMFNKFYPRAAAYQVERIASSSNSAPVLTKLMRDKRKGVAKALGYNVMLSTEDLCTLLTRWYEDRDTSTINEVLSYRTDGWEGFQHLETLGYLDHHGLGIKLALKRTDKDVDHILASAPTVSNYDKAIRAAIKDPTRTLKLVRQLRVDRPDPIGPRYSSYRINNDLLELVGETFKDDPNVRTELLGYQWVWLSLPIVKQGFVDGTSESMVQHLEKSWASWIIQNCITSDTVVGPLMAVLLSHDSNTWEYGELSLSPEALEAVSKYAGENHALKHISQMSASQINHLVVDRRARPHRALSCEQVEELLDGLTDECTAALTRNSMFHHSGLDHAPKLQAWCLHGGHYDILGNTVLTKVEITRVAEDLRAGTVPEKMRSAAQELVRKSDYAHGHLSVLSARQLESYFSTGLGDRGDLVRVRAELDPSTREEFDLMMRNSRTLYAASAGVVNDIFDTYALGFHQIINSMVPVLLERLKTDLNPDGWDTVLSMLDSWDGSIRDLIELGNAL